MSRRSAAIFCCQLRCLFEIHFVTQVSSATKSITNEAENASGSRKPMGTLQQMRQELRLNLESTVEKNVMDNQMHKSKASVMRSWLD